jgi:hypothetical protein
MFYQATAQGLWRANGRTDRSQFLKAAAQIKAIWVDLKEFSDKIAFLGPGIGMWRAAGSGLVQRRIG